MAIRVSGWRAMAPIILVAVSACITAGRRLESYVAVLADPNLNSMREQLALLDGVIIPGALKRGEKAPTHAGEIDPLRLQLQAIDVKSKIVKRLADTEQNRKIAFTPDELRRLIVGLVAVVAEFVDADMLRKISTRIGVLALSAELG
jgi:hypothetical protein